MNPVISGMMAQYPGTGTEGKINSLRNIFQHIALLGLWRAKFFEHAAFYGGTALRLLYNLDRFSEDIDFSLIKPNAGFNLDPYCRFIEDELKFYGFSVTISTKNKTKDSQVKSAFLKANTLEQLLVIEPGYNIRFPGLLPVLKIKLEVDTDPPPLFQTEVRFLLNPIPFSVKVFNAPSLFSGKMHALLCREWKNRVKGRDWYDFVWFISRSVPLNLNHLEMRMRQSGHWTAPEPLSEISLKELVRNRIHNLNINRAKEDVSRFLPSQDNIAIWSEEFFYDIAGRIQLVLTD
ncbi:MAG: nucleotidyl transferase AbiEii/AbiGii toxin family protein [Bacteroidia bacterium]|nr:nucleotidyl transferase AbiEii/AbiGii toxin family protein [Bacteroidia bacterium]